MATQPLVFHSKNLCLLDCCEGNASVSYAPFESVRAATHLSAGVALLSERSHPRDEAEYDGPRTACRTWAFTNRAAPC